MPNINITVDCPVHDSFRVRQVAGLFDVPLTEKSSATFSVELPSETEPWQIGLIVGPSGSGKSTIARRAYGDRLVTHHDWPRDKAIVDCFGELPIKQITGLLTAVGFSSPPSWIKPYHVLSGGEQFRCDLARALALKSGATAGLPSSDCASPVNERPITQHPNSLLGKPAVAHSDALDRPLIAFDEFTSVVDRNVARIGSAAVAKAIRAGVPPLGGMKAPPEGGTPTCRFVAVTCHYDVARWLEPDWIVDMATTKCIRRRLRRPPIELQLHRVDRHAWPLFARHHYLSGSLNHSARCYLATWKNQPVTFCATLPIYGCQRHYRISRIVTLPDYQGIGLGMRVAEAVAELHVAEGLRFNVTASHPALIAHCRKSPHWRTVNVLKTGSRPGRKANEKYRGAIGRAVVSFEYKNHLSFSQTGGVL
jgi:GNAT superfamily N-acetyltransferase